MQSDLPTCDFYLCRLSCDGYCSNESMYKNCRHRNRVRFAEWIPKAIMIKSPFAKNYFCSNCNNDDSQQKFCSHCGAEMSNGDVQWAEKEMQIN